MILRLVNASATLAVKRSNYGLPCISSCVTLQLFIRYYIIVFIHFINMFITSLIKELLIKWEVSDLILILI